MWGGHARPGRGHPPTVDLDPVPVRVAEVEGVAPATADETRLASLRRFLVSEPLTNFGGDVVVLAIVSRQRRNAYNDKLIVALAARHRLPAVCSLRRIRSIGDQAAAGGERAVPARGNLHRSHPQGREAADLPVQAPTKYELTTAKALGLDVPATLLARATNDVRASDQKLIN